MHNVLREVKTSVYESGSENLYLLTNPIKLQWTTAYGILCILIYNVTNIIKNTCKYNLLENITYCDYKWHLYIVMAGYCDM